VEYARRTYIATMNHDDLANQLGALALALADDMRSAAEAAAGEAGPAAAALVLAGHAPGLSIAELAPAVGLSHPGAVRMVDRLAGDGLLVRRPDARDRRAVGLHLTAAGIQRAAAVQAARAAPLQALVAALTNTEAATLAVAVARLLTARVAKEADALRLCRLCDHTRCATCPAERALAA
jgi:DNA-binding MarR family transcriptional regulator